MKPASPKEVLALLHKQGFRCAYTGDPLTPENCGGDHRIPVSRGGDNSIGNMALVLTDVNSAKRTMTLEEFREMCSKVVAHTGATTLDPDDTKIEELSGLTDPIEILTRHGYAEAANEVLELKKRLERSKYGGTHRYGNTITSDELIAEKREILEQLQEEIRALRVKTNQYRNPASSAERQKKCRAKIIGSIYHQEDHAREEEISV